MANQHIAVIEGTVHEGTRNFSRKEGKYFTILKLNCETEIDKRHFIIRVKFFGEQAKYVIHEHKVGARVRIRGYLDRELKNWRNPYGDYVDVVTVRDDDECEIEFIEGHYSVSIEGIDAEGLGF